MYKEMVGKQTSHTYQDLAKQRGILYMRWMPMWHILFGCVCVSKEERGGMKFWLFVVVKRGVREERGTSKEVRKSARVV
jgi:hypothetical protein